ncbi:hypothetical protein RKLH11_3363 [Rhodobacteraceae bacterium KLH11]|nr:hypothetical protein RKLH11_3363 [Rhodobacteraceae bacterium KLH11]
MSYDVQIDRLGRVAVFDLKGTADAVGAWVKDILPAFPVRPNTRTEKNGVALCYIGRNHWLLRAARDAEERLEQRLKPTNCPADISIVRVSDTLTFFHVTGPDAADVMAIACPLDLHETVFPPDAVTYSEFFGLKALVTRCEGGFECAVEQSFGDMVADYLARATA